MLLLVVSDHGFTSFRRGVNLNNALWEMGLLAFRDDLKYRCSVYMCFMFARFVCGQR